VVRRGSWSLCDSLLDQLDVVSARVKLCLQLFSACSPSRSVALAAARADSAWSTRSCSGKFFEGWRPPSPASHRGLEDRADASGQRDRLSRDPSLLAFIARYGPCYPGWTTNVHGSVTASLTVTVRSENFFSKSAFTPSRKNHSDAK
jgi:hypothetical protein